MNKIPGSAVSHVEKISDEGLARLEKQLQSGISISNQVLQQWLKRYVDETCRVLKKYDREIDE